MNFTLIIHEKKILFHEKLKMIFVFRYSAGHVYNECEHSLFRNVISNMTNNEAIWLLLIQMV